AAASAARAGKRRCASSPSRRTSASRFRSRDRGPGLDGSRRRRGRRHGGAMSRTRSKREHEAMVVSERAAEAVGPYPHARRAGNLLFVSGIGPRRRGAKEIPGVVLDAQGQIVSYDIVEQCRSVFENIRFILEDAGSSWDRIVDVTAFLTNMSDFAAY